MYFQEKSDHIVESLNAMAKNFEAEYVLVMISPEKKTDIHYNPTMAKFVNKFLPQEPVSKFLSNKNEIDGFSSSFKLHLPDTKQQQQ